MNGIETLLLVCESQFNQTKEMNNDEEITCSRLSSVYGVVGTFPNAFVTPVQGLPQSNVIERELNFDEEEEVRTKVVDPARLLPEDKYDFQNWLRRKTQIEKELADKEFIYLARCAKIEKELVILERSFLEKKLELIHLKASHL